ncbi:MAG: NrsF family protein [Micropepsaceae bacterium]
MRKSTDKLIEHLSGTATPVKPLLPPSIRALMVLLPTLFVMALVAWKMGNLQLVLPAFANPPFAIAFFASLATGILSVLAALNISIPGRSDVWGWIPVIPAIAWVGAGVWECAVYVQQAGVHDYNVFASADCFAFIVMTGTVVAMTLYYMLRNSVSTDLFAITALGGLGAATLANALLTFFHPPGTNPVDFLTHLTAVTGLIAYMATLGRSALGET